MSNFSVLIVLSCFSVCLSSLPVSLFVEVNQPQTIWEIFSVKKPVAEHTEMLVKTSRGISPKQQTTSHNNGIFWRPWNHQIPEDAVVGGFKKGECGEDPIYMAQVYKSEYDAALIPVEIFSNSKSVAISYAGVQKWYKKDIKVLCAKDPSILTWVSNKDAMQFNVTADEDCVIGGSELQQKFHTFFGRATYEDETIIGKVLYQNDLMYFPHYGDEQSVKEYEILCYEAAIEVRRAAALKMREQTRMTVKKTEDGN